MMPPDPDEIPSADMAEGAPSPEKPQAEASTSPGRAPIIEVPMPEWEQTRKDLSEYKDKYLRLLAENENNRKRWVKEREEYAQQTVADVVNEFLTPLDHFENALQHTKNMSSDVQNWATGFQMILAQFKDALSSSDIQSASSLGEAFDPHYHEAIEVLETEDHAPGTIVQEYRRGYSMGTGKGRRTIRHARVKVAKKPTPATTNEEETQIQEQEEVKGE